MTALGLPWLELAVGVPLLGALWPARLRDAEALRRLSVLVTAVALLCTIGAYLDFVSGGARANDHLSLLTRLCGREVFALDELSAPLLPMVALVYFLTMVATLRTKVRRFRFTVNLVAESVLLATFCSREAWLVVGWLSLGAIFPYLILRARDKSPRVYLFHMLPYVGGLAIGQVLIESGGDDAESAAWRVLPLVVALWIRNAVAPFHCWVSDLFEKASFGGAVLFAAPLTGAYAAARLLLPIAPTWILAATAYAALATAAYAAAMSLIQNDGRRFFAYLLLSHASLVLFGLCIQNPLALAGALCVWLSTSLALCGLGLTLRAMESRCGRLSLVEHQGLYEHTPNLAMCFALAGLAAVGFPGTFGFIGAELLIDGGLADHWLAGATVVGIAALNGIAIVQTYFRLFTGTRFVSSVSLLIRVRERYAVLTLAALIFLGGLFPNAWIRSRYRAADHLMGLRRPASHESRGSLAAGGHHRAPASASVGSSP